MSDENLEAWNRADQNKKYYALRLTVAYIKGDMSEADRFADMFIEADAEQERLDRELGDK